MKLIIPVGSKSLNAPVCPSLGRTPFFLLFDTANGSQEFLDNTAAASQGGAGIKAAQALADSGATVLITCRCGENAAQVLQAVDIKIFKAEDGSAAENIVRFKAGALSLLKEIHPGFHHQGDARQ